MDIELCLRSLNRYSCAERIQLNHFVNAGHECSRFAGLDAKVV
jgi:hypothetical protein